MLVPVIIELSRRGHEVCVLGLTLGKSVFQEANIVTLGLHDLLNRMERWSEIEKIGCKLLAGHEESPKIERRDSIAYLGSGFLDLVEESGLEAAKKSYTLMGRKAFKPVKTAKDILAHLTPDLVVTTNAPRMEQAMVLAAGESQIPCLVVIDAFAKIATKWLKAPDYADRLCVFHPVVKRSLVCSGRPATDIAVTGNPVFDRLSALRTHRLRTGARHHVLYLSQNETRPDRSEGDTDPGGLPVDVMTELVRGINQGIFTAEVRFHPNQLQSVRDENPGLLDRSLEWTLEEALGQADLVVTASSTAGIEAQMLGLPLVQIGWSMRSGLVPFEKLGPVVVAHERNQLIPAIEQAFTIENLERSHTLGTATSNVADQVESLLS